VRHPAPLQRRLRGHLVEAQAASAQRHHPTTVKRRRYCRRRQASSTKLLQRRQQRVQTRLLDVRHAVHPVVLPGGQHAAGIPRQLVLVVAEVEPARVPPAVRRDEARRDVLVRPTRPQLKDAAPYPHCVEGALPSRVPREKLGLEKVEPQVPLRLHPEVSLADRRKDGGLRDGVGGEVVELHPVVVEKRPHEDRRRDTEPPLVEAYEAHHVAFRRGRLPMGRRRRNPLRLRPTRPRPQQPIRDQILQLLLRHGRGGPAVGSKELALSSHQRRREGKLWRKRRWRRQCGRKAQGG
jgi:hypothetical protein